MLTHPSISIGKYLRLILFTCTLLHCLNVPRRVVAQNQNPSVLVQDVENWPGWRGPRADGAVFSQSVPNTWSDDRNVLWKVAIPGRGHSSPIVDGGMVFLTTAVEEGQTQFLLGIELSSGKMLWETPLHRGQFSALHRDNTQASATPASDGKRIYTAFGNKDGIHLSAVDRNGRVVWSKQTGPYPSEHGFCSSVCIFGNQVFIAGEALHTGFLAAYESKDGTEIWRVPRKPDREHANYATPIVVTIAGQPQLIIPGWHLVSSYDPKTGKLLWENPGPADVNANSVAVQDPYVIVSGGYPQKKIICINAIEPVGENGRKVVWESTRNVAWVPTPLIHDNKVMILSDSGVLTDMDLKTGEIIWTERLGGAAYASPIRIDEKFIATTRDGKATVFTATEQFGKIADNVLGDGGGNATPVAINNRLLIRTDGQLFCIGEK